MMSEKPVDVEFSGFIDPRVSAQEFADALHAVFGSPEARFYWEVFEKPLLEAELLRRGYDPATGERLGWLRRAWMKARGRWQNIH